MEDENAARLRTKTKGKKQVKSKEEYREKILPVLLLGFLSVQLLFIAWMNLVQAPGYVDCDSAKLYVHAIEIWRNHNLFVPGWKYITTAEFDCSLILAVPLYALTGNIYLAFGVANLLFAGLYLWVLFGLFEGKSMVYPLLCGNLIFLPYSLGMLSYFNMLFFNGGQYVVKVLLPLLLVLIILGIDEGHRRNKKQIFTWIIYSLLLLLSAISSGVYVFVCGLFPVLAGYVILCLYHQKKIPIAYWLCCMVTVLLAGTGYLINAHTSLYSSGNGMILCTSERLLENIGASVLGLFELFEGLVTYRVDVVSFKGISLLVRIVFVLMLLVCAGKTARKVMHREASLLQSLLLAVFLWNTFVLFVCDTGGSLAVYNYRYHLIGAIPLLCLAAIALLEEMERCSPGMKTLGVLVGAALLLVLDVSSWHSIILQKEDYSSLQEVCDYAENTGAERVYFLNDSSLAEICRLLDHEGILYLGADEETGTTLTYDYYLKYADIPVEPEGALLVIENLYGEQPQEELTLFGDEYTYRETIGEFVIYQSGKP